MKKNIVIVHYNTPYLTECLVRSINLFVSDAVIYIFDNSNKDPFTARFDNVTILDNTKGQIIDFDKWLEKYPRKHLSHGRVNGWGSAKHCYSVERCMEILNDNFILLDSDVILKKDLSDLFNDKYIYCGEIITQPNSTINRVLPFITFINTKMCKENNIHYFDDRYMHGLANTTINSKSDYYDTGAGFYLLADKMEHKEIKCDDYVTHYGHGSWDKKSEKKTISPIEWLSINKNNWSNEKNKNVIYTCITGKYDTLLDPTYITEGFDYICFTDNEDFKSKIWDIRPLPKETEELSQVKKQRYVKLNPHKLLHEYDISIWVDGNVSINGDLNEFINSTIKKEISVYVPQHPSRNCIYAESKAVISMKKDKKEIVDPQMKRYEEEGFPKNYGLLQSNILLRKHNESDCIRLMEAWFDELKENSHRDQLSFNYVLWKNSDINVVYMDKFIYKSKWFKWNLGHKKYKTNNKSVISDTRKRIEERKHEFKRQLELKRQHRLSTQNIGIY